MRGRIISGQARTGSYEKYQKNKYQMENKPPDTQMVLVT